ncbi:MAG: hypothetical protein JW749_03980 [Sedimentisphaerales bacterium]|nr:hypothetical protein [Sedimentisphaerales bacterium]
MNPAENIERLIKNFCQTKKSSARTTAKLDEKILDDALTQLAGPGREQTSLWRILMKNRTTQLAAAVVIITAVGLSVTLHNKFVSTAYAIEQTIDAMKNITIMHLLGRDTQDGNFDMWVQVNPETGLMTNFYLEQKDQGKIVVSTPKATYTYDRNASLVEVKDGPGLESPFRIGRFIEDMNELANRIGGRVEHYEEYDSNLNKNVIVLEITSRSVDIRAVIDPVTKLPIRFDSAIGLNLGQSFSLKDVEIFYEEQAPEGIFGFVIPDGAKVIRNTVDRRDELLAEEIIQYAHEIDAKCPENNDMWCNTQIRVVDDKMNVFYGSVFHIRNDSEEVWTDEVTYANSDGPGQGIAVFDEKGNKLETRFVQDKLPGIGDFRLYIKLNEPLLPGQSRSFVEWLNGSHPCCKTGVENIYSFTMQNFPGKYCLESFILVLAPNVELVKSTQNHTFYENINGHSVYVWQEYVPTDTMHKVTVELRKRE